MIRAALSWKNKVLEPTAPRKSQGWNKAWIVQAVLSASSESNLSVLQKGSCCGLKAQTNCAEEVVMSPTAVRTRLDTQQLPIAQSSPYLWHPVWPVVLCSAGKGFTRLCQPSTSVSTSLCWAHVWLEGDDLATVCLAILSEKGQSDPRTWNTKSSLLTQLPSDLLTGYHRSIDRVQDD